MHDINIRRPHTPWPGHAGIAYRDGNIRTRGDGRTTSTGSSSGALSCTARGGRRSRRSSRRGRWCRSGPTRRSTSRRSPRRSRTGSTGTWPWTRRATGLAEKAEGERSHSLRRAHCCCHLCLSLPPTRPEFQGRGQALQATINLSGLKNKWVISYHVHYSCRWSMYTYLIPSMCVSPSRIVVCKCPLFSFFFRAWLSRRRMEDLLRGSTAVAPSLQPYVAGAGAVETGLYRFLSPITIQASWCLLWVQRHRGPEELQTIL